MASSASTNGGQDLQQPEQRPSKKRVAFGSNSQPEQSSSSKKMRQENLSVGFHRKELSLRMPLPPHENPSGGGGGEVRSSATYNVAPPTIAHFFRFQSNIDSPSLPSMSKSSSECPGVRSMSQETGTSTSELRNPNIPNPPRPLAPTAEELQQRLMEQRNRFNMDQQRVPSSNSGPSSSSNSSNQYSNNLRRMRMYLEQRQKMDDPEKKIRRLFRDLCVELTHNPNETNVRIRIFQKYEPGSLALRINGRPNANASQPQFGDIQWMDFKYAKIQLQFFKPDETDKDSGRHLSTSRVFELTARGPCGLDLCSCNGPLMCFRGIVCPFSAVKEYFSQASVLCTAGHVKMPVLHIILSVTFYSEEEMDLKTMIRDLRDKSVTDVGKKVLCEGLHSDFTLKCEGRTFACHKSILAAHSDVFAAMFNVSMAEVISNELEVNDISAKGVEALLKFLYHGEIDAAVASSTIAYELLKASHKYQIVALEKITIELLLLENDYKFEISTVLDMFVFCGQVDLFQTLQDKAVRILKSRPEDLVESDEYEELLVSSHDTAKELFKRVCFI